MHIDQLIDGLPAYAKDMKLNYSTLVRQNAELSEQQLWGTLAVSAVATRCGELTAAILEEASKHLTQQVLDGAKAAAAIMGMNNIFYRFHHLSSNEKYGTMPARLRMNVMRTHGVDALDFELWSLAVSAINGCGKCIDSHEKVVREKGASEDLVLAVVRLASIVHAIGTVLDTERVAAQQEVTI
ncbi:carboxymuconolactone decarboxylase family protein [Acidipila rosea]|uniref:Alkyl hydroperoxide reductase AhpD n=1 Tax=Acidipila rosea TaxID=768535 RepID=A0A4V2PV30_9BACT|nr:carboxymuconolactone decarboxylase family protein [Acidipila rosea]MBW4028592.1 alkyl hydroperoxide reductase [Acidobacteriota bacterium]MBW4045221.1 alkyl hydroperoxide reductase [Acidobacteriota bacterium]TCK72061.1 alkyl hydroperoxide reductase subunit D [Acidipila rosea]